MANQNWLDQLVVEPVTQNPTALARLDSLGIEVVNQSETQARLSCMRVMVVYESGLTYYTHFTAVDTQADWDGAGRSGWIRWQRGH